MDNMSAFIAGTEGNLLFYSNGCAVANRNHDVMPHGDSINRGGGFFEQLWEPDCRFGYSGRQDITILPDPANAFGYYIVHYRTDLVDPDFDLYVRPMYTYVDM